jgi:hypothetical protein
MAHTVFLAQSSANSSASAHHSSERALPDRPTPERKTCFRTEQSYFCLQACELRRECCKSVAEWLRRS